MHAPHRSSKRNRTVLGFPSGIPAKPASRSFDGPAAQAMSAFGALARRARRPGFTLVELLVVLSIIVMLAAITMPFLKSLREDMRLFTGRERALAAMQTCRLALEQYQTTDQANAEPAVPSGKYCGVALVACDFGGGLELRFANNNQRLKIGMQDDPLYRGAGNANVGAYFSSIAVTGDKDESGNTLPDYPGAAYSTILTKTLESVAMPAGVRLAGFRYRQGKTGASGAGNILRTHQADKWKELEPVLPPFAFVCGADGYYLANAPRIAMDLTPFDNLDNRVPLSTVLPVTVVYDESNVADAGIDPLTLVDRKTGALATPERIIYDGGGRLLMLSTAGGARLDTP